MKRLCVCCSGGCEHSAACTVSVEAETNRARRATTPLLMLLTDYCCCTGVYGCGGGGDNADVFAKENEEEEDGMSDLLLCPSPFLFSLDARQILVEEDPGGCC